MRTRTSLALGLATVLMSTQVFAATPLQNVQDAKKLTAQGHLNAAFERTEKAETGLLNEQAAGDNSNAAALDPVKKAHSDLAQKNRDAANADLDSAISALNK